MSDLIYCQCGCGNETSIAKKTINKRGQIKGKHLRYISGHNLKHLKRINLPMENHRHWKGGKIVDKDGYVKVRNNNHLRSTYGYVFEHILIAEKALGKSLPGKARIHHYNNISDNRSIIICQDHTYHLLLHRRKRALESCGHANWRMCRRCHKHDDIKNLRIFKYGFIKHIDSKKCKEVME